MRVSDRGCAAFRALRASQARIEIHIDQQREIGSQAVAGDAVERQHGFLTRARARSPDRPGSNR